MTNTKQSDETAMASQVPDRSLTAESWLSQAAPETDYYKGRHPRTDTSLWALLLFWVPILGLVLGIMGIVKGATGTKNGAAIGWGITAVLASIIAPIAFIIFAATRPADLTVGEGVTTAMGVSMKIPEGATLVDNSVGNTLYQSVKDGNVQDYGVYPVVVSDRELPTTERLVAILNDTNDADYPFWLYQLFGGRDTEYKIESVRQYKDVAELVVSDSKGTLVVAVHRADEVLFVQYLSGAPASVVAAVQLSDWLDESSSPDIHAWRTLVDSFSYKSNTQESSESSRTEEAL